jgi:5-methylthioadenosine/S-adenosylhomocysteine deaminase
VLDVIIRNARTVTMGDRGVVAGDLGIDEGRIVAIGRVDGRAREEIDAAGAPVLPGFVQAHVHLGQTLFRGIRDDVDVVDWLRDNVWPLEQAHDASSMAASCRLGVAELLLGGTTTVLSMETVAHTDEAFSAAEELGIRAFIGKALMDRREPGTDMYGEDTADAQADLSRLIRRWDRAAEGRLRVALTPRCPRGVTDETWRTVVELAAARDLLIHTHVAESRPLAERAATSTEGSDIAILERAGALSPRLVMAHTVWPADEELELIARRGAHVCHCPSANLKLASGIAPIPTYLERGINVALGADGAACNNNLDAFQEMRLAALIHKPRFGPRAMPGRTVLEMATLGGARALGIADDVGSIEVGKLADVVVLAHRQVRSAPESADPISEVVYSRASADVRTVLVGGRIVVRDGVLVTADQEEIAEDAQRERRAIEARAIPADLTGVSAS